MGVCCVVFDIDGILFEFRMNFLHMEKIKVFFAFYAISNIYNFFFLEKHLISFRVLCSFQHYKFFLEILKSAPSLTG